MKKTDKQKTIEMKGKAPCLKKPLTPSLAKLEEQYIRDLYGDEAWETATAGYLKGAVELDLISNSKIIDIHTQTEVVNPNRYTNTIDNALVKRYVFQNINFPLNDTYWELIDISFYDIWNNKIGIGGEFYWDEISKWIFEKFQKRKILIEYERIDKIARLILTYIKTNGGFLE